MKHFFIDMFPYLMCFLLLALINFNENDLEKAVKRIERLEKIEKEPYARQDSIMNEHLDKLESKLMYFLDIAIKARNYNK